MVTQDAIDAFADVTGGHPCMHAGGAALPWVLRMHDAHGYYTLSLAPMFIEQVMSLEGFAFAVNYGLNKVRFPAPVPVGSRVRATARLAELQDIPGGAQIALELTFEVEGGEKSACVAQTLARVYTG